MIKVKTLKQWLKDKPDNGNIDFISECGVLVIPHDEVWLLAVNTENMIENRLQL